jgi:hypothetical protein
MGSGKSVAGRRRAEMGDPTVHAVFLLIGAALG